MTIEEILTKHAADPRAAAKAADPMLSESDTGGEHAVELDQLMADRAVAPDWADGFVSVLSAEALRNLVTCAVGDLKRAAFDVAFSRPAVEHDALEMAVATSLSAAIPARLLAKTVKASLAEKPRDVVPLVKIASKVARMPADERIQLASELVDSLERELLLGSGPALVKCIVGLLQDAATAYQHPDDHGMSEFASTASMLRKAPGALRDATNSALAQLESGSLRGEVREARKYDIEQNSDAASALAAAEGAVP